MESVFLDHISVKKMPILETVGGDVLKVLSNLESEYEGFGEVYFSELNPKSVKAWKYHYKMTLNLVVPLGEVKFVFFKKKNKVDFFKEITIGRSNYSRITVKPGIWFGFKNITSKKSIVMNVANIAHEQEEVDRKNVNEIKYNWKK